MYIIHKKPDYFRIHIINTNFFNFALPLLQYTYENHVLNNKKRKQDM